MKKLTFFDRLSRNRYVLAEGICPHMYCVQWKRQVLC